MANTRRQRLRAGSHNLGRYNQLRPMAYQVLARKYRPIRFSDVVGQDHVTRTLLNALAQNRIAHGYIFSGHRGIGKTTIARILASALNCRTAVGTPERPTPEPCNVCESCIEIRQGSAVDVIEIDAATNRGIDEIRELRDAARYRPARDRFKIYILDEAHQITDAAFNALLKTLEEPPDHIVFMMATTQPEDIPQTIRSRCQHFSFHAVKLDDIMGQLRKISADENLLTDEATLALLAEAGDGSMRDALSIMDQAIASAPLVESSAAGEPAKPALEAEQVRELMGTVSNVIYEQVLEAVHRNNSADVLAIVARLLDAGNGAPQIARQFVRFLRNCVVAKITALDPNAEATGIAADLLQISPEERSRAARSAALFNEEDLSRFLAVMLRTFDELGYRQEQRFHLELGLLKLVHLQRLIPIEDLLSQLGTDAPKPSIATTPTAASAPRSTPSPTSSSPKRPEPSPTLSSRPEPAPTPSSRPEPTPTLSSRPERSGAERPATPAPPPASPFDLDRTRKTPQASAAQSTSMAEPTTSGSLAIATDPIPAPRPHLVPNIDTKSATSNSQVATDNTPPGDNPPTHSADASALQHALLEALANTKGQDTTAHFIEDATVTLNADTLEIQTAVSKAMLGAMINAEATRIITATLRERAPGLKFVLLPGTAANAASANKAPRPARAGSVQELAEKHPVVQEAKRLFSADLSNVIDLRDK